MPSRVQFVLPGLFDLPMQELGSDFLGASLPHLNRLLRLATVRNNNAFTIDAVLRAALGWDTPATTVVPGLPLAQAFAGANAPEDNRYLLFQAIHLKPDLHSALILPIEENSENLIDISILINDLKEIFKVDCDIAEVSPGIYLMRLLGFDAPLHYPHILSVLGKTVNPYIEQSRQILPWYQLLNEMQMFLHQHEINAKRLLSGSLPINSLWFWGAGRAPAIDPGLNWYCDDALLRGFAQSLGLRPKPLQQLDEASPVGDSLVVDLRLMRALKSFAGAPLRELLLEIDETLLKPILDRVRSDRGVISLRAGFRVDFELGAFARFKIWRKQQHLGDWLSDSNDF